MKTAPRQPPPMTHGRIRRRCAALGPNRMCGVEVDIAKPAVRLSQESTASERRRYSDAIRQQILFPALCGDCRAWWNKLIRSIQEDRPESESED